MADNFTFLDAAGTPRTIRADEISTGIWVPHHRPMNVHQRDTAGAADDFIALIGGRQLTEPIASPVPDTARIEAIFSNHHCMWVEINPTSTVLVAPSGNFVVRSVQRSDLLMAGDIELTPKFAPITVAGNSTDATIVASVPSKKIRVINVSLFVGDVTTTIVWGSRISSTTTALSGVMRIAANGGYAPGEAQLGHFETAAGAALVMTTTGTGSVTAGHLAYVEV